VPVSSSQAVIGAVLGISLVKGGKGIRYNILGSISSGWVTTPIIACLITFIGLFFLQNVFSQQVSREIKYKISAEVIEYAGVEIENQDQIKQIMEKTYGNSIKLSSILKSKTQLQNEEIIQLVAASRIDSLFLDPFEISTKVDREWLSYEQYKALKQLAGNSYYYPWQLSMELQSVSQEWKLKTAEKKNKLYNKEIMDKLKYLTDLFKVKIKENE